MSALPAERMCLRWALALTAGASQWIEAPASAEDAPAPDTAIPEIALKTVPDAPPDNAAPASTAQPPSEPAPPAPEPEPEAKKGFFSRFIDEEDGKLDFSNFLARGGFIPIPSIITEPAGHDSAPVRSDRT